MLHDFNKILIYAFMMVTLSALFSKFSCHSLKFVHVSLQNCLLNFEVVAKFSYEAAVL